MPIPSRPTRAPAPPRGPLSPPRGPDLSSSIGPYTLFDKGEPFYFFAGLPRDRQIAPFATCRRASEEGVERIKRLEQIIDETLTHSIWKSGDLEIGE